MGRDAGGNRKEHAGDMLASTWLQCVAGEGVGGPFMTPGGLAEDPDIDKDVTRLQKDAGIRWWLEEVKKKVWSLDAAKSAKSKPDALASGGAAWRRDTDTRLRVGLRYGLPRSDGAAAWPP